MRYAAYGSNLHPLRLVARAPSAVLLGTGYLQQWSLRFHKKSMDNSGKCNVIATTGGIHVAVYEMNYEDKLLLDRIEGLGSGYRTGSIRVPEFGDCFTYVAEETHIDDSLTPYDWYRELVLLGCLELAFPDAYVKSVRSVEVQEDPDALRGQAMWDTIDRIRRGSQA